MDTIPYVIAAAIFVVSEFFIPVDPEAPNRKIIKHFWSFTLAIIGLVLSYQYSFLRNTETQFDNVQQELGDRMKTLERQVADLVAPAKAIIADDRNEMLWEVFVRQREFVKDNNEFSGGVLNQWVNDSVRRFSSDIINGYVELDYTTISTELSKLYAEASTLAGKHEVLPWIAATNVGGTALYFDHEWYENAHKAAVENRVPIIRFFIHDPARAIRVRGEAERSIVSLPEFGNEAQEIHERFLTLFSAVISTESCPLAVPRDLLLVNGALLIEGELTHSWDVVRVKATGRQRNLIEADSYFIRLMQCISAEDRKGQFLMPDVEVADRFRQHLDQAGISATGEDLARKLVESLLAPNPFG